MDGQGQAAEVAVPKPVIHVNVDRNYIAKEVDYHFKKDKELGTKRNSVKLQIPAPTVDLVLDILDKGGKELELLLDVMTDQIVDAGRQQVSENEAITQETLDLKKLSWVYIANLPKAERRGGGISKETWKEFYDDYVGIMPAVTGKTAEQVGNAAKLFIGRLQACKTNKKVLSFLKDQLAMWFSKTQSAEDFATVYEFLDNKASDLLKMDEAQLLANL